MVYKLISPGSLLRRLNDTSFYLPHEFSSHPPKAPFLVLDAFWLPRQLGYRTPACGERFQLLPFLPLSSPLYGNDCQSPP